MASFTYVLKSDVHASCHVLTHVVQRDLKAGNLLIQPDGTVLLADFGVGGDINLPPTPVQVLLPPAEAVRFDRPRLHIIPTAPDPAPPLLMREIGKRQSFVGTVSR